MRDGEYTLRLEGNDVAGSTLGGEAKVIIDGSAPKLTLAGPSILPRTRGVVTRAADSLSGVRLLMVRVNGRLVARTGGSASVYRPPGGWRPGRYVVQALAVDAAGNRSQAARTFTVRAPRK